MERYKEQLEGTSLAAVKMQYFSSMFDDVRTMNKRQVRIAFPREAKGNGDLTSVSPVYFT